MFIDHDKIFSLNNWDTALLSMHHPKNHHTCWSDYFVDELEFGNTYGIIQKISMAGKIIYSFEARNNLNRLLNTFHPDIAHIHCIYHHISPSILSLLHSKGIPCVMTAHDLKVACPAYKMLNKQGVCEKCKNGNLLNLIKYRCIHDSLPVSALVAFESAFHKLSGLYRNNLDMIVTPSIFFREKLIEWGWQESKLTYIPNFIDCNEIIPHYEAGKYFLYFGRLAPEKGIDTLIKAAVNAKVTLKIAGTGPFEQYLKSIAVDNDNVEFVGYKSGNDLWSLINNARAVVLPSEWYENAPVSILESYAAGKPVIGADIGGIPEMLLIGTTGYLFESGNVDDLTDKLLKVNSYPDIYLSSLGRSARDYVSNTFNIERYFSNMLSLYRTLGVSSI